MLRVYDKWRGAVLMKQIDQKYNTSPTICIYRVTDSAIDETYQLLLLDMSTLTDIH